MPPLNPSRPARPSCPSCAADPAGRAHPSDLALPARSRTPAHAHAHARAPAWAAPGAAWALARATLWGAVLALAVRPALAAEPQPLPDGSFRVQQAEIVDRQGFDKPMRAGTVLLPAGWALQSGVHWDVRSRCGSAQSLVFQATAPDGQGAIALAPSQGWGTQGQGARLGQCTLARWSNAQAYLQAWVQQHRPGARWLDYRPRPDKLRPMPPPPNLPGMRLQVSPDSGQALIAYQDQAGRDWRETLATVVVVTQALISGNSMMPNLQTLQGQAFGVLSWKAPAGQLPLKRFDAVWATLRSDPDWQARVRQGEAAMAADNQRTQAQIAQINAQSSRDTLNQIARRGEIRAQTQRDISDMQQRGWQNTQASNDQMHTDRVRALREVQPWREPGSGRVVELSHHYEHAWKLRDGSFVLTDNPNFDPQRDLGLAGEAMKPAR